MFQPVPRPAERLSDQLLCDWPQETLLGDASYFIAKHQLTQEFEDLRLETDEREEEKMEAIDVGRIKNKKRKKKQKKKA